ncbi:MAG: aminotransferase class IV, partial [Deinococcales bacterium]|nr:aminotransferase class IV [Deinococcales bacterium]
MSRTEAVLHLSDIGFRRSYAAFDYLRVINGRPLFMEDHLDRFENSARILRLELQLNRDDFQAHLLELADLNV